MLLYVANSAYRKGLVTSAPAAPFGVPCSRLGESRRLPLGPAGDTAHDQWIMADPFKPKLRELLRTDPNACALFSFARHDDLLHLADTMKHSKCALGFD